MELAGSDAVLEDADQSEGAEPGIKVVALSEKRLLLLKADAALLMAKSMHTGVRPNEHLRARLHMHMRTASTGAISSLEFDDR